MAETNITWGQRIRTWLVVTLITLLVWLYAEGEAVTTKTMKFSVKFLPPPNSAVDPVTQPVTVEFRGSNGQLRRCGR